MPSSILIEDNGGEESSNFYQVLRSFQVSEETDATKSIVEELELVALFTEFLERKFHLGMGLSQELRLKIIDFLKANVDCFALSHYDMVGILLEIAVHKLSLDPNFTLIRKKK